MSRIDPTQIAHTLNFISYSYGYVPGEYYYNYLYIDQYGKYWYKIVYIDQKFEDIKFERIDMEVLQLILNHKRDEN